MYLSSAQSSPELTDFIRQFFDQNAPSLMIHMLHRVPFESRKDICVILSFFVRRNSLGVPAEEGQGVPLSEYVISHHPEIIQQLLSGLQGETALPYGQILQDFTNLQDITEYVLKVLNKDHFERLYKAMNSNEFEISSEACVLFKDLFTKHPPIASEFLQQNEDFFVTFMDLMKSSNYATRRFALRQLGDLLLNRENFQSMIKFVKSDANLKIIMQLLKDSSQAIRIEAFHVFKIFVACPEKPESVRKILAKNKEKLIEYLEQFQLSGPDEEDEKQIVIKELKRIM